MSDQLMIGIDVGTTAVKAAAFKLSGEQVSAARRPVTVLRESDGFSEIVMEDIWTAVADCLRDVASQIDPELVVSIGVCGQGDGLWSLDSDKQPVRNAILWNDARASSYISEWSADGTSDTISRFCRTANWPGTAGSALRWIHDNEPENFARIAHIVFAKDWIICKLTGHIGTDFSDATIPFLDLETRQYAPDVFAALGLPDWSGKLPPPSPAAESAGTLNADVGLPAVPVSRGTLDLAAMMVGVGLNAPGDMCLILGTTAVLSYVAPPEPFDKPPLAATVHHPLTMDWIRVLAPQTGASAFDWFAALHPNSFGGADASEIAAKINDAAQDVPPGANGVLFLPFLTGERAPFVAPDATGSFHGLRINTTKADLARAVMEGTGYSLRHCLEASGAPTPERVVLTGGGARNRLWCQIIADILGVTIIANASEDHGLWGAALLGGASAGLCDPLSGARDEDFKTYDPGTAAHAAYTDTFPLYLNAINASHAIWAATRIPS